MPLRKKVGELQALKDRRSRMREVRDLEERMLLDSLEDTERGLRGAAAKRQQQQQPKGRLQLSHHNDIRQLQINYERLRERERPAYNGRNTVYSSNSDSSMSIYLPDEGDLLPRRNPDPQLAQLAASHGRQMEMLQGKNKDLERQRDEIRRRLEELGRRPIREEEPANSMLDQLKEQEARNQRLLDELRRQLADARQPINIIAEEHYEQNKPNLTYPIYYGSSLVAEISAIRQAYLQNGGNDPAVLAQLAQMLAEAQAIEDQLRNAPKSQKVVKEKKSTEYLQHLTSLEMENERMQRELMLLQEQNMLARQRRKDDREDELEREIRRLQQEHLRKMYELQREIERARTEHHMYCHQGCNCNCQREVVENPTKVIIAQAPCPPPPPPPPQIIQQPAPQVTVQPPQQRYMEVEQVVPYDQYFSYGPRIPYGGVTSVQPFQTMTPMAPQIGPMMPMGQQLPIGAPINMPQQSWVSTQSRRVESETNG